MKTTTHPAVLPDPVQTLQQQLSQNRSGETDSTQQDSTAPAGRAGVSGCAGSSAATTPARSERAETSTTGQGRSRKPFFAGSRHKNAGLYGLNLAARYLKNRLALLLCALCCGAFGFVSLGAYIVRSQQSALVPYLVEVDSHGVVLGGQVLQAQPQIPQTIVAAVICQFVRDLRLVTPDNTLQSNAINAVYSHIRSGDAAQKQLDAFYQSSNPFEKSAGSRTEVLISSVIAQSDKTYQVDWVERTTGELDSTSKNMRALVSYSISPLRRPDAQTLLLNPAGIYIKDFTVTEIIA